MAHDPQSTPAAVLAISTREVLDAIGDPALPDMPDGPAKALLNNIATFASGDYDPGDVIVLVVRPPGFTGLAGTQ